MKISKVFLSNFRAFYGTVEFIVEDINVFIGKNDRGKSSILEAIDIFVNEGKGSVKILADDLNVKAKGEGVQEFKIGLAFTEFPNEIVIDATNSTNLRDEYLLNDGNQLEIWKSFKNGKLISTYIKSSHPSNDDFIKNLMNKKIKELQSFVSDNKIEVPDKRVSALLRRAIRNYYESKDKTLSLEVTEIPIDAEGLKDIWGKIKNYMPVFAMFHSDRKNVDQDDEIQDPLKIKIDEIFKRAEIVKMLDNIGKEVNKELESIANNTVKIFKEISKEPSSIKPNIPEVDTLKWKDVYKGLGFNTDNDIPLNKRGSGFRRLVLLSSFLADVERKGKTDGNVNVIYALEEPETSMHPDLQIKLIKAMIELANQNKYQIFLTTHSPALIRLIETKNIYFVDQTDSNSVVSLFDENVADKIISTMGLLPNLGKVVICVEGTNDEKFLINVNQYISELKDIIDLRSKIDSGILAIIPMRGSNLIDWINRYALKNTNAIEFHLYDRDPGQKYKEEIEKVNNRNDGSFGILTDKREIENYVPKEIIEETFGVKIKLNVGEKWDDIDIPKLIKSIINDRSEDSIKNQICGSCSKKLTKNHLEKLKAWDEVKGWFGKIKELTDKCT